MRRIHRPMFGLAVAVGLALTAGPPPAAAADPTPVQARAQSDIVDRAERITKLAYVTARSHSKVEYVKGTAYRDETFDLTYKFYYRDSDNDPQTYTLRFVFSPKGKLQEVATVNHSSFWEPFNALKLAGAIAEGIAKELDK